MTARGAAVVFGASGGIGQAFVRALVSGGRYEAVNAGSRKGQSAILGARDFRFDLRDETSIAAAVEGIPEPLRLVIVATGTLHDVERGIAPEKSWRSLDAAVMADVLADNAIGPALIAKHCLPRFSRDDPCVFAALSARVGSIADNHLGGWHSYRASKAALNMLVRNFAIELARSHPQALAVALHPGTVATPLSEPFTRSSAGSAVAPDLAATRLLSVLDDLGPADSGGLFAWDGVQLTY